MQNNTQDMLFAGTGISDITPPLSVGLLTSSVKGLYEPFTSVRSRLKARAVVFRSADQLVAIVSLDLLMLNDTSVGGWEDFKASLSDQVPAENIIIICTHTHNGPESAALSDLYLGPQYQAWLNMLKVNIRKAIDAAVSSLEACTLSLSTDVLTGYSLQRRIAIGTDIIMSDSLQPIPASLMQSGPIDHRIKTLKIKNAFGGTIATLVHGLCHPVHEMCMPHISADFPGELCRILEEGADHGMSVFLNGAAGDINPPTVSCGPETAIAHGKAIAAIVSQEKNVHELHKAPLDFFYSNLKINSRTVQGMTNPGDAIARIKILVLGELAMVFLPGEQFVATALDIEQLAPFEHTIVVGYAENSIGYVPTATAFLAGGYETGPGKWSFLEPGADKVIKEEVSALLEKTHQNTHK
jgi:neutral ceramidase